MSDRSAAEVVRQALRSSDHPREDAARVLAALRGNGFLVLHRGYLEDLLHVAALTGARNPEENGAGTDG